MKPGIGHLRRGGMIEMWVNLKKEMEREREGEDAAGGRRDEEVQGKACEGQ